LLRILGGHNPYLGQNWGQGGDDSSETNPERAQWMNAYRQYQQQHNGLAWLGRMVWNDQIPDWWQGFYRPRPDAQAAPVPQWQADLPSEWASMSPEAKRAWWTTWRAQQQTGGTNAST
jgi:hypothetical protein